MRYDKFLLLLPPAMNYVRKCNNSKVFFAWYKPYIYQGMISVRNAKNKKNFKKWTFNREYHENIRCWVGGGWWLSEFNRFSTKLQNCQRNLRRYLQLLLFFSRYNIVWINLKYYLLSAKTFIFVFASRKKKFNLKKKAYFEINS